MFVAKGDNKMAMDPCTSLSRILGRVDKSVPKKYLHGLYRLPCGILNKSDLPLDRHSATGVQTDPFEVQRNRKLVIAICTACANYNWVRPLEIHLQAKLKTVSYLEFHVLDDVCVEDCIVNINGLEYDTVLGLGDPVFYDSLNADQKALYVTSQILVVRQYIETRIGERKYGQNSQLDQ